jgi:hypothetical protein
LETGTSAIQQSGVWKQTATSKASGGSYLYSADGTLTLTFSGSSVDVLYLTHNALGSFVIEVDGVVVQTNPSTLFQQKAQVRGLAEGQHTLRIYPKHGVIAIDAVITQ